MLNRVKAELDAEAAERSYNSRARRKRPSDDEPDSDEIPETVEPEADPV